MQILCERPETMPYDQYRKHLREQKAWIKSRRNGIMIYLAAEYEYKDGVVVGKRTAIPFRGIASEIRGSVTGSLLPTKQRKAERYTNQLSQPVQHDNSGTTSSRKKIIIAAALIVATALAIFLILNLL